MALMNLTMALLNLIVLVNLMNLIVFVMMLATLTTALMNLIVLVNLMNLIVFVDNGSFEPDGSDRIY